MSDLLYKRDKTSEDIDALLMQHKNLVYYMLTKMGQLHNQDAESAAWEALWDAVGTFDVFGNNAFSTYACRCIKNGINNILRQQQREKLNSCEVAELSDANNLFTTDDYDSAETLRVISAEFDWYMRHSSTIVRDVLQMWRSSGFCMSATDIAKVCNTSASYVTRIQCSFRAHLSGKLRG